MGRIEVGTGATIELVVSVQSASDDAIDLLVRAESGTKFGELRPALRRIGVDSQRSRTFWIENQRVDDEWVVGTGTLRHGAHLSTAPDTKQAATAYVAVVGGRDSGRRTPLSTERFVVGRAPDCDLVLADPEISRRHLEIEMSPRGVGIRDLDPTNPTRIAGQPLRRNPARITHDQVITIGRTKLSIFENDTRQPPNSAARNLSPSSAAEDMAASRRVELPGRRWTTQLAYRSIGVMLTVGISVAMAVSMPNATTAALVLASPLVSILMMASASSQMPSTSGRSKSRRRASATVKQLLIAETAELRAAHPDAVTLFDVASTADRLYSRRQRDPDFLQLRIGIGDLPSATVVVKDSVERSAGTLHDVPVSVDLQATNVALIGSRDFASALARFILAQIVVMHHPADVRVLLLAPSATMQWRWLRWAPHVHAIEDEQDLAATISNLSRRSATTPKPKTRGHNSSYREPHIILVIDGSQTMRSRQLERILCHGTEHGVTALFLQGHERPFTVPLTTVVSDDDVHCSVEVEGQKSVRLLADLVSAQWSEQTTRVTVAGTWVTDDSPHTLDRHVRLTDLLGSPYSVRDIQDRWARHQGLGTAVGNGRQGPIELDLIRDGPHALVAGTTGAGKSGFLQALIVGLAISTPPSALNFVLIDYKGGAAFGECEDLPHTTGLVTDLDPYLTMRALASLQSEIRRRERQFRQYNAHSYDDYEQRRDPDAEQFARLVIVVDEFATLSDELPTFVDGLVSIARSGRSLGIHLILATQRPQGVVSAQIRSNVTLRVALRVTDPIDSLDVINSDVASSIDPRNPGRAFVERAGLLDEVQTGSVGMVAEPPRVLPHVQRLDAWLRPSEAAERSATDGDEPRQTDLQHMVGLIRESARLGGLPPPRRPWVTPLPTSLTMTALEDSLRSVNTLEKSGIPTIETAIGIQDLPEEQTQVPLSLRLREGQAWLVTGASRSGKTTTLGTIAVTAARSFDPEDMALYGIDYAGGGLQIAKIPHCGGIANRGDFSATAQMVERLLHEVQRRRNTTHPWTSDPKSATRNVPSRVILLVDGWDDLMQYSDHIDNGRTAAHLLSLAAEGTSVGFTTVIAGGRATLSSRVTGIIGNRLILSLADRNDYALLGVNEQLIPNENLPGRAILLPQRAVVQLARSELGRDFAPTVKGRSTRVTASRRLSEHHTNDRAIDAIGLFRPLPQQVSLSQLDLVRRLRTPVADGDTLPVLPAHEWVDLGIGGNDATIIGCDLAVKPGLFAVVGAPGSGRTNVLAIMLTQLRHTSNIFVVAEHNSRLSALAGDYGVRCWAPHEPSCDFNTDRGTTTIVLVDDMAAVAQSPLNGVLVDLHESKDLRTAIVVAGQAGDFSSAYHGLGHMARLNRTGVLLSTAAHEAELFGLRVLSGTGLSSTGLSGTGLSATGLGPVGRALLVNRATHLDVHRRSDGTVPIQLAAHEAISPPP